jgi:kynurenine formamidase
LGGGIDTYSLESLSGPAQVFDISDYPLGRAAPVELFRGNVEPGDIVLLATQYVPPQTDVAFPKVRTITNEAAEYLASLPIRAIGTDAFSIEDLDDVRVPSLHHEFLGRGIPLYESLFNVEALIGKGRMYFTGVPLNIPDADGMIVRPVVFVY